jgi:CheY-like chemotaxis protein
MAIATADAAPSATPPPRGAPLPEAPGVELALVMDRAAGLRLAAAERLVRSLPGILGDGLLGVELHLSPAGTFTALARVLGAGPEVRRRLAFWCARAGARSLVLGDLPERERSAFKTELARCRQSVAAEPDAVAAEARRLFTAAGAPPGRPDDAGPPELQLEVGGAEWSGVRWEPARRELFVPGPLAPPEGDDLSLLLRLPGSPELRARARVAAVRGAGQAGPGAPAGFTLAILDATSELALALERHAAGGAAGIEQRRAHPRYTVRAPARVRARGLEAAWPGSAAEAAEDGAGPRFVVEDLSLGGAFVKTGERLAPGSIVEVACTLPTGDTILLDAEVVSSDARGMGLRWKLDPRAEEELASVVARTAARPRRALVADDDALSRKMISDALQERGFDVICAADGISALRVVSEELLSLDLLVADLWMPGMGGQQLLRTIRRAGGETDLAIVMVSGSLEGGLDRKLEREGADAVLKKDLGPRIIAQTARAILERKRAAAPA